MLKRLIDGIVSARRRGGVAVVPDLLEGELLRAGDALSAGRSDEALALAEAAAAAFPDAPEPLVLQARIHLEAGRADESAQAARSALRHAPKDARASLALPRALAAAGDVVGAERAFQRAQSVAGDREDFWIESGLFSLKLGRLEEAFSRFQQAVGLAPQHAAGWINLAIVEQRRGALAAALRLLEKAVTAEPDSGLGWANYGLALRDNERLDEAIEALRRAARLRPSHAVTRMNFGTVLLDDDQVEEAQEQLKAAVALAPNLIEAHVALALVCQKRRDTDGARVAYERALAVDPGNALAQAGLAELELWCADFAHGWKRYEHRHSGDLANRRFNLPAWDGAVPSEGALLVYSEQGIGDMILFASCIPDLQQRVPRLVLEVPDKLHPLMANSFPGVDVVPYAGHPTPEWFAKMPVFAAAVAAGSLMQHFRSTAQDYPRHDGYLVAETSRVERWRERLERLGRGPRIGVSWQGGFFRTGRKSRSLALEDLAPILSMPGATFVSLQYTKGAAEEAEALRTRHGINLVHWQDGIDDYAETAALVGALDLVITVCTAVAHLAGALGRPTWILTPMVPSWRYLGWGDTLPWYPSARLFRQSQDGGWAAVVAEVRSALVRHVGLHVDAGVAYRSATAQPVADVDQLGLATSPVADHGTAALPGGDAELREIETLYASGARQDAIEALETLLAARPEWIGGYLKAAQWHLAAGDRDSAQDCLELALHYDPTSAPAVFAKAEIQEVMGQHFAAVEALQRVVELLPESAEGHAKLARAQYRVGRFSEARAAAERALALASDHGDALQILGVAQIALEDFNAAVQSFELLVERYPRLRTVRVSLGSAYIHTGRFDDARRQFDWVIANEPNNALARWDYATLQLADREFAAGWENYEYRHHALPAGVSEPTAQVPRWEGEPLEGRSIVVFGEQGLGDEIMFASCLPDVVARASRVLVTCDARLIPLIERSFPGVLAFDRAKEVPAVAASADYEAMCGTLPLHCRRLEPDFPRHSGYLRADPGDVARWRERLAELGPGPRIGISWRGGSASTRASLRTIPLAALVTGLSDLGLRLVSLQYGACGDEIASVRDALGVEVAHFPEVIPDYDQTAALVTGLDAVVTVCTSIVHLTGALGRPLWVLVPSVPEWRYGRTGEDMPWYPSARLVRQAQDEPWAAVIGRLRDRLSIDGLVAKGRKAAREG